MTIVILCVLLAVVPFGAITMLMTGDAPEDVEWMEEDDD